MISGHLRIYNNIEKEVISTIDIPEVVKAAKRHRIDGIMTLASDRPMRTVAAVAKEMNIVGIDEKTAINATNKYEMRKALLANGVPVPLGEVFQPVNLLLDGGTNVHAFAFSVVDDVAIEPVPPFA